MILRRALVDFGSETPDNVSCVQQISVSKAPARYRKGKIRGLALRRRWLISEILNYAEGSRIPKAVRNRFRGITQQEWNAVQRLTTLVFTAFEVQSDRGGN